MQTATQLRVSPSPPRKAKDVNDGPMGKRSFSKEMDFRRLQQNNWFDKAKAVENKQRRPNRVPLRVFNKEFDNYYGDLFDGCVSRPNVHGYTKAYSFPTIRYP